jgi:hypothetical protein
VGPVSGGATSSEKAQQTSGVRGLPQTSSFMGDSIGTWTLTSCQHGEQGECLVPAHFLCRAARDGISPFPFSQARDSRGSSNYNANGRYSETPASSMAPTADKRRSSSIHSVEPKDTPEMKRLKKRHHLLKEIVDTESAFFTDMTVAEEIYKGSANAR